MRIANAPKLKLTDSDAKNRKSTGKQTPIMHENKLSNLKKIGAQDQLEVGVSQDRDKKSSRSKGSKSRFFDYKWLKIANKDKKATPGASSKKKSSLCKSSRVIEGHQENFKSFSLNKLIPKLSLISKDHIACSERSPLPSKRRQRTRQSPPKSSSKKSKRELLSKRSQKGHSESNIVSHLLLPQTSLSR